MNTYVQYILLILGCIISSIAQVLLKMASQKKYPSFFKQFFNFFVITGYTLFFSVLALNIYLLKFIPMSIVTPLTEATPVLISFLTGFFFFGERISKFKILGGLSVIIGSVLLVS